MGSDFSQIAWKPGEIYIQKECVASSSSINKEKPMLVFSLCEVYSMCCEVFFCMGFHCFLGFFKLQLFPTLVFLCPAPDLFPVAPQGI